MIKFRLLKEKEIDVRVQNCTEKGVMLLLYKDARCDMNILDETVGIASWQKKFYNCKETMFCSVGVKHNDEWIWKDDAGTESNQEAKKGEASDSFKRACFNWGIGRELYTSPFIFIQANKVNLKQNSFQGKTKFSTYDKFEVEKIKYDENRNIIALSILNSTKNERVFVWQK